MHPRHNRVMRVRWGSLRPSRRSAWRAVVFRTPARGKMLGMSEGSGPVPPVEARVVALRLRGRDYWYGILRFADIDIDELVYRRETAPFLYDHEAALLADLESEGIPVDGSVVNAVDVDHARRLIGHRMSRDEIDTVITAWNALDDLAKATGTPLGFFGRLANRAYDKLFYGLNLPSVTPPGEWYSPAWRPRELAKIDQVLREVGARVSASAGDQSAE